MRSVFLASAAVFLLPAAALAQDGLGFNGVATIGYSFNDSDIVDFESLNLALSSDIVVTPNFSIGFDLDAAFIDVDEGGPLPIGIDVDATRFAIEPMYSFGNGFSAGVYYQTAEIDLSAGALIPVLGLSIELESYGIAGRYDADTWYVGAYYGQSDTDPGLPSGFDIDDYGVNAGIKLENGLEIYGQLARTSLSGTGLPGDIDADLIAIGANHTYENGLSVYGSLGRLALDIPGLASLDPTQFAIGVGYDLSRTRAALPAMAHLEVAQTSLDLPGGLLPPGIDDDVTKISFGITFALGGGQIGVPLDSSARIATGDIRSALVGGLGGLF